MPAVLGCDVQTGQSVSIGDIERRSGLYVLGKSGMGKSSLLVNILLSDITSGYGVFFIDPHGDAIRDLDQRLQYSPIILDPQHEDTVFGINLLACKNIQSFSDRTNTYIRAYNIFHKLWKEQWGPWMQLIMQHALYVFIENQDYTLAELPLFLRNPECRTYLLQNVTYAMDSVDFWRYEYQEKQSEAVRTRINTFLGHPHVKHIVGQQATSINFQEIMDTGQVVCVRLSAGLPGDIKEFIGTILISELLRAVRGRTGERRQFCVFVDEFQHFLTDDMADLINEGRKFGIATTISHLAIHQFSNSHQRRGSGA